MTIQKSEIFEYFARESVWGFDTETTGLCHHQEDTLFAMSLACKDKSFYFDVRTHSVELMRLVLIYLFCRIDNVVFMHNAKFDMHFAAKFNSLVEFQAKIYCTEMMARVYENNHLNYTLDACAKRLGLSKIDAPKKWIQKNKAYRLVKNSLGEEEKLPQYFRVPLEIMEPYALKDAELVLYLGKKYFASIEYENRMKLAEYGDRSLLAVLELESNVTKVLFHMEQTGVLLNKDYTKKMFGVGHKRVKELDLQLKEMCGGTFTDSSKFLKPFFEKYPEDMALIGRTETGLLSLTVDSLAPLKNPLAALMRERRKLYKEVGTYYSTFLDVLGTDGRIHPNFRQAGTKTGRMSCTNPNCVSMDTEVLSKNGWVLHAGLTKGLEIACFNVDKNHLQWEVPTKIYKSEHSQKELLHVSSRNLDFKVTKNHRVLYENRKTKKLHFVDAEKASNYIREHRILHGGILLGGYSVATSVIQLCVAVQADATFSKGHQVIFGLTRPRKIERLKRLLGELEIPFKETLRKRGITNITFSRNTPFPLLTGKEFNTDILRLSYGSRVAFFEELSYWDGNFTRLNNSYCSNSKNNIDIAQAVAATIGIRGHISLHSNKRAFVLFFAKDRYSTVRDVSFSFESTMEPVWCVEVSSGAFLARRNGHTFITGNCQNIPKGEEDTKEGMEIRKCFGVPEDFLLVSADYDSQEYKLLFDLSGQADVIAKIKNGLDPHTATADLIGCTRKEAKTVNFSLLYGSGTAKLCTTLFKPTLPLEQLQALQFHNSGFTMDTAARSSFARIKEEDKPYNLQELAKAQAIKDAYFYTLPNVKNFIKSVIAKAKNIGWVCNWLGRIYKYDKDFAYSAPNGLIQGGSADVVKIAMVSIAGLLQDKKSRMILQVHDELNFYIHKDEVALVPEIRRLMCEAYPCKSLPLTVSIQCSLTSWGELEPYDETRNYFQD